MVYERIKDLSEKAGMSIRQLEARAGLANGTIGKWRDAVPSATNLFAVAKVLETSMEDLLQ